ncbi:MAG: TlpA family protein disulfide reductase [Candidatus Dormibacteria bacterium]
MRAVDAPVGRHTSSVARLAVLSVATIASASCGLQADLGSTQVSSGATAAAPAPSLSGSSLDGKPIDIRNWRGHVVVIDWWGSWCGPCHKEQPQLDVLSQHFTAQGVHFVGVDILDNRAAAQAYVLDFKVPYPSIFDPATVTADPWLVIAPPTIVVVDADGRIRGRFLGTLSGLQSLIQSLIASKSG